MYVLPEIAHNCFSVGCPVITALWKEAGDFNLKILI
jgi:hypothetical protein